MKDITFGHSGRFRSTKLTGIAAVAIGVTVAIPSTQVLAQGARALEEILVTSRRYEESITDAPLAVAVLSSQNLIDNRVDSIQDILELTPGADWGQFAKAQPGLALRGIAGGAFGNASLEHDVSVVNDGVPLTKAFMMTIPTYDLQRVEVLRGPQGTTFGRNATLGLMSFVSARPSQDFGGNVSLSTGERGYTTFTGNITGAINDELSARLAIDYRDVPGAMDSAATGDPLEDAESTAVKASLLWEPSDSFSAWVKYEAIQDQEFPTVRRGRDQGGAAWLNPAYGSYVSPVDPWEADISPGPEGSPWEVTRDMRFVTAELSWALDNDISVTSITGTQVGNHYSNSDAFGTPYDIRDQIVYNDASVFSQEVRIDNQASGNRLRWLVGASLLKDSEHRIEINESEPQRNNCNATDPDNCFRNSTLYTDAINETDAYGIFGEITYDISDQLTLSVGGRYSSDERTLDFATWGYGSGNGLSGIGLGSNNSRDCEYLKSLITYTGQCGTEQSPVGFADTVSDSWNNFKPKVSLSYAVNENNNVYVLYSEGFKAGGFQQDARTNDNLALVLDEVEAKNYEFGWKGSYDTLVFAITAFKQEQLNVHTGNLVAIGSSQLNLLVNAAGVENTGLELEGTWAATDNLTVGGSIASYSPEFAEGSVLSGTYNAATGAFEGGFDVAGQVPAGAIEEASYLFAEYEWQMSDGSSMRIRGDWRHRGEVWGQNGAVPRSAQTLNDPNTLIFQRPSIDKLGLSVNWRAPEDNWGWSVWGRNLDNDPDYINFGPPFGYLLQPVVSDSTGAPQRARAVGSTGRRQIGATIDYSF
jgi:iron complex outermembrane recepter protein